MRKKVLIIGIAAMMTITSAGCFGNQADQKESTEVETVSSVEDSSLTEHERETSGTDLEKSQTEENGKETTEIGEQVEQTVLQKETEANQISVASSTEPAVTATTDSKQSGSTSVTTKADNKSNTTKTETAKSETTKTEATKSEATESETTKPESTNPETTSPSDHVVPLEPTVGETNPPSTSSEETVPSGGNGSSGGGTTPTESDDSAENESEQVSDTSSEDTIIQLPIIPLN